MLHDGGWGLGGHSRCRTGLAHHVDSHAREVCRGELGYWMLQCQRDRNIYSAGRIAQEKGCCEEGAGSVSSALRFSKPGRQRGPGPRGKLEQVAGGTRIHGQRGITRKRSTGKDNRKRRRVVTLFRNWHYGGEMVCPVRRPDERLQLPSFLRNTAPREQRDYMRPCISPALQSSTPAGGDPSLAYMPHTSFQQRLSPRPALPVPCPSGVPNLVAALQTSASWSGDLPRVSRGPPQAPPQY